MGLGDQLMASGMARGAVERGKRIAFGDGRKIIWDKHSPEIFKRNLNIAIPGSEGAGDLEWIGFYKGNRIYNTQANGRWIWNYDFHATPGEVFFDGQEKRKAGIHGGGFIVVEPNVPAWKSMAPNKDWGKVNYQAVVNKLRSQGRRVVQFAHARGSSTLAGIATIRTRSFREALAVLANAALYIGPEGGLHHGAAAVGIPAIVIFGGFIPPQVTGYETHTNLTGGATACGNLSPCEHCRDAMRRISVEEVTAAAENHLKRAAA